MIFVEVLGWIEALLWPIVSIFCFDCFVRPAAALIHQSNKNPAHMIFFDMFGVKLMSMPAIIHSLRCRIYNLELSEGSN